MLVGKQDGGGCWAFLRARAAGGGGQVRQPAPDDFREQIRETIIQEMRAIEAALAHELESVSARVARAASKDRLILEESINAIDTLSGGEQRPTRGFRRAVSDDGASPKARQPAPEPGDSDDQRNVKRAGSSGKARHFRRRRTVGADGSENFTEVLRNSTLRTVNDEDKEDDDEDASSICDVVSVGSERHTSPAQESGALRRSWQGSSDGSERFAVTRFLVDSSQLRSSNNSEDDSDEDHNAKETPTRTSSERQGGSHLDRHLEKATSAESLSSDRQPSSSTIWRVDALDFGDRLAATTAAKKGSASIESIIELVQTERERWCDEKQALEARLEELKAQQQQCAAVLPLDPEKEALKRQVHDLRQTMKLRSRFGAWVCERHMKESDDEEEEETRNADKESLRSEMRHLEVELRNARAEAAASP